MKKKFFLLSLAVGAIAMLQLNVGVSSSNKTDISLNQLVQKAEACAEIIGGGYRCCPSSSWCYIGGGYEMYPFYFNF